MDAGLEKEIFDFAKTIIERLTSSPVVVLLFISFLESRLKRFLNPFPNPSVRLWNPSCLAVSNSGSIRKA
jgi:hypothetical protein